MASTRSDATTRGAGRSAPADTPKQVFLALVRHGARIQIAACTPATLLARPTTASSVHLRELTALPRSAADRFDTRLARVPTDN